MTSVSPYDLCCARKNVGYVLSLDKRGFISLEDAMAQKTAYHIVQCASDSSVIRGFSAP